MRGARFACTRSSPAAAPPAVAAVNETGAIPPGNAPGQTLWQQRRCVQGVAAAGWGALSTGILENHAHRLIPRRPAGAPSHPAPRAHGHHAPLRPTRTYTRTHAHTTYIAMVSHPQAPPVQAGDQADAWQGPSGPDLLAGGADRPGGQDLQGAALPRPACAPACAAGRLDWLLRPPLLRWPAATVASCRQTPVRARKSPPPRTPHPTPPRCTHHHPPPRPHHRSWPL